MTGQFCRHAAEGDPAQPRRQTMKDATMSKKITLTVTEAAGQIPYLEVEAVASDLLSELNIRVADANSEELKTARRYLQFMVKRALWALEPVTIIADPEDEDADAASSEAVRS
jgi:hypothetical protein